MLVTLIYYTRADVCASGRLAKSEAAVLHGMFLMLSLAGFFLVDGGDSGVSHSVFTRYLAPQSTELSALICWVLGGVGLLLGFFALVDGIRSRYRLSSLD